MAETLFGVSRRVTSLSLPSLKTSRLPGAVKAFSALSGVENEVTWDIARAAATSILWRYGADNYVDRVAATGEWRFFLGGTQVASLTAAGALALLGVYSQTERVSDTVVYDHLSRDGTTGVLRIAARGADSVYHVVAALTTSGDLEVYDLEERAEYPLAGETWTGWMEMRDEDSLDLTQDRDTLTARFEIVILAGVWHATLGIREVLESEL